VAFKRYKKAAPGKRAGPHPYTREDMRRAGWCHQNNIFVAVTPNENGGLNGWNVEIRINDKTHLDPNSYSGYDAQTKMYEYYKYYYDKNIQESK